MQGALGALSFAHEWKKLTKPEELERLAAGWFLGNAGGAGKRWGNGLSFKNELRVSFEGDELILTEAVGPAAGRKARFRRP